MFRLPKSVPFYGAVAIAAASLILAAPQAAHAIAVALVQVTNTAASPAITQGTEKQAAQLLELICANPPGATTTEVCGLNLPNGGSSPYTPGTQSYVITGVDFVPAGCGSASPPITHNLEVNGNQRYAWIVPESAMSHFTYPSGIVTGPGAIISITAFNSTCEVSSYLSGYLTAN